MSQLEYALTALKQGRMVLLFDSADRENEGDLVMAAEKATPEAINFMITQARGLVCLPMSPEYIDRLNIPMMTHQNHSRRSTQFTVSIEATEGITTGISAADRAHTIKVACADGAVPADIVSPGHIFPLRANEKGVLARQGHTEGSVDLMKLAGLKPAAVICEVSNVDGSMARFEQLEAFSEEHDIPLINIQDIVLHRLLHESWVELVAETVLPVDSLGEFQFSVYEDKLSGQEIAVMQRSVPEGEVPLVRLHSACFTGDMLGSLRCDCGGQLKKSLQLISEEGGVLLYLPQEGRGIGLANKVKAYALQDKGMDTVEANLALGFKEDDRDYAPAAHILKALGLGSVKLLTNNPKKIAGLRRYGIAVLERVPIVLPTQKDNADYMAVKASKLGHLLAGE